MSSRASRSFLVPGRLFGLWTMSPRRRALLAEAAIELALAALTITFRPFRRTMALGAIRLGRPDGTHVAELASAVTRSAALVPFRAVCFGQGLALQRMARRRGIDARLHYGVATSVPKPCDSRGLHAHVWVTVGGEGILGHHQAKHFRELLRSPA